eukprot:2521162-Rhodomonas_salina.1
MPVPHSTQLRHSSARHVRTGHTRSSIRVAAYAKQHTRREIAYQRPPLPPDLVAPYTRSVPHTA